MHEPIYAAKSKSTLINQEIPVEVEVIPIDSEYSNAETLETYADKLSNDPELKACDFTSANFEEDEDGGDGEYDSDGEDEETEDEFFVCPNCGAFIEPENPTPHSEGETRWEWKCSCCNSEGHTITDDETDEVLWHESINP